ncbi:MAG: GNAT family N-acetyltransferase [Pseudomonadales bacterium]
MPERSAGPEHAQHRAAARRPADLELRDAEVDDLWRLLDIEQRSFSGDLLSRRALRYLVTRAHAINLVACVGDFVTGYVGVLLRRGSDIARVYTIAVDPDWRGRGIGNRLLAAAEQRAAAAGRQRMRLEVRLDNAPAINQYHRAGYLDMGRIPGYYQDGQTAIRMQKRLSDASPGREPA